MNWILKTILLILAITVCVLFMVTMHRIFFSAEVVPLGTQSGAPSTDFTDLTNQTVTALPDDTFISGEVQIQIDDFMNNGQTFEDPMNPGNYILMQDIGYCASGSECNTEEYSSNFDLWFDGEDRVFYIRLLQQPIAASRLAAERFLQRTLNLSPRELCDLQYYMSVSEYTDTRFAGQHLQFSTCAGAQSL